MRQLRRICATLVLTLIIADAARAGEGIMYPGYIPPPPPPTQAAGIMYPGVAASNQEVNDEEPTVDLVTDLTLSLIQNLLALF
ncbi:MAG TPA: hypothetical protein VIQ24_21690 [Pyrinomonadaceae bacterium]